MNKKETHEDKYARKYYCKKAAHNYIKFAKRNNLKKLRRKKKEECNNESILQM